MRALLTLAAALIAGCALAQDAAWSGFGTIVGPEGQMSLESLDYRAEYVFLGTWAVNDEDGVFELHQTYTQPETIRHYVETGEFPDGAVFVKELQHALTDEFTTGRVGFYGEPAGWFVMVRDREGRFGDNPLWGEGWGWALFDPEDASQPVTEDYEAECIACHEPARETDLIYVQGYPLFEREGE